MSVGRVPGPQVQRLQSSTSTARQAPVAQARTAAQPQSAQGYSAQSGFEDTSAVNEQILAEARKHLDGPRPEWASKLNDAQYKLLTGQARKQLDQLAGSNLSPEQLAKQVEKVFQGFAERTQGFNQVAEYLQGKKPEEFASVTDRRYGQFQDKAMDRLTKLIQDNPGLSGAQLQEGLEKEVNWFQNAMRLDKMFFSSVVSAMMDGISKFQAMAEKALKGGG